MRTARRIFIGLLFILVVAMTVFVVYSAVEYFAYGRGPAVWVGAQIARAAQADPTVQARLAEGQAELNRLKAEGTRLSVLQAEGTSTLTPTRRPSIAAENTPVPVASVVADAPTLVSGGIICPDDWPKTAGDFLDRLVTGQQLSDGTWMPAELKEVFRPVGEPEAWAIAREEGFVDGKVVPPVPFWASNAWWEQYVQDGWYVDAQKRQKDGFEGHPARAGLKAGTSGLVTGVTFRCRGAPMAQTQAMQGGSTTVVVTTTVPSLTTEIGWTEAFVRQTFNLDSVIKLEKCPGEQNCWQLVAGQGFVVVSNPTDCWLTGYCKEKGALMPGETDPKTGIAPHSRAVEVEAAQFRPCL